MLNKYYNNSQKHVEKCSESFEDFRNISFIEHVLSLIFLPREFVCHDLVLASFIMLRFQFGGQGQSEQSNLLRASGLNSYLSFSSIPN